MKQKLNLREMVKEIIKEEQKTAWSGRFENLDKILSKNYDQMDSKDRELKDTLFRSYYRYFNDGDVITFPSTLFKKIGYRDESSAKRDFNTKYAEIMQIVKSINTKAAETK